MTKVEEMSKCQFKHTVRAVALALVGSLMLSLASCGGDSFHGIPDVDHWQKELADAKDPDAKAKAEGAIRALTKLYTEEAMNEERREGALDNLRKLKDPATIPVMLKVWADLKGDKANATRQKIAGILGDIGDRHPEAAQQAGQPLLDSLKPAPEGASGNEKKTHNRLLASIITALGKMKYTGAAKQLVNFLGNDDVQLASASAEALAKMNYKEQDAIDGLMKIIGKEGQNWSSAKRIAIQALGELRVAAAIPMLIVNLWNEQGRNYAAASDALFKIGEPAAQPLIDTFLRKNTQIEELNKTSNFPPFAIELKSAEVLGDLETPAAAEPLMAAVEAITAKMDKDGTVEQNEARLIGIAAMSAGRSRSPAIAERLAKASESHSDQPAIYSNFQLALILLSDTKALASLWKVAEDDKLEFISWDSRAKAVEAIGLLGGAGEIPRMKSLLDSLTKAAVGASKGQLTSADQFAEFSRTILAKNEKMGKPTTKAEDREQLKTEIEAVRDVFVMVGVYDRAVESLKRLETTAECKGDVGCLSGKLKSGTFPEQDAAAWGLARTNKPEAMDALMGRLAETTATYASVKDKAAKGDLNKVRQSIMFAMRVLAQDPAIAKAKLGALEAAVKTENVNKKSVDQIYWVARKVAG